MKPTNNFVYVIAVVIMIVIAIIAVVVISVLRPDKDNTVIITAIFGFLAPTTLSLLALLKAQETHLVVNSRMSDLIDKIEIGATAMGVQQGVDKANERTDLLVEQNKNIK